MCLMAPSHQKYFTSDIGRPSDRMGSYIILYIIHTYQMRKAWRLDLDRIKSATLTAEKYITQHNKNKNKIYIKTLKYIYIYVIFKK